MRLPPSPTSTLASLQKTLEKYESGKYALESKGRAGVQVPNTHKPGPNPNVVLPKPAGRPKGVTEIEAVFTVDQYKGIVHGRNGDHEVVEGHITLINAVANRKVIDTQNVELAMNVSSKKDPAGLPSAIPLKKGDQLEIEGEYIPASKANTKNQSGAAAVIHFTHAPAGYVILPDAREYQ